MSIIDAPTAHTPTPPTWIAVSCPSCKAPPGCPCDVRFTPVHIARERRASRQLRRRGMLDGLWCPICSRDAVLVAKLDRFLHTDGSSNHPCWAAISGGEDA
jgi:hypothetical protein